MNRALSRVVLALLASSSVWAANVNLPGGTLTVAGTSSTGASFTYTGTLTQNDTITLSVTGQPCLQTSGTQYCTNAAGVLLVPGIGGSPAIGGSSGFSGFGGSFTYGALMMTISGVGSVQVFPTNVTNGSGSGSPPSTLTITGATLQSLGFANFSQVNPTITFTVGDTFWGDNGGQFVLTGTSAPVGTPISNTALIGTTMALALIGIYQMNSKLANR